MKWLAYRLFLALSLAGITGTFASVTIHYPPTVENWVHHESPEISRN